MQPMATDTQSERRYSDRLGKALEFAADVHATQVRKQTEIPYVSHLLAVCSLVLDNGGTEDEAIAALLHDAAEDQGGRRTLERIGLGFGESVAKIVEACSDSLVDSSVTEKAEWKARKEAYLAHLERADRSTLLVSVADKLHNAMSIERDYRRIGAALWERFSGKREGTLWYYGALVEAYERAKSADHRRDAMLAELREIVKRLHD
jgi:(p)ppGpp synthase/HD superfamily hydrolase